MRYFLLFTIFTVVVLAGKDHFFVFEKLNPSLLKLARLYGNEAYKDYVKDTENRTEAQRQSLYIDYFERCNDLGWDYAKNVTMIVAKKSNSTRYKTLMKLGVRAFLSRFLTLPAEQINSGIDQLCTKSEMQLQCQYGFGESRSQILLRIEHLKEFDGSMRLLLDKECNTKRKELRYECIGGEVEHWTKNCTDVIDVYNETRWAVNKEIAQIHISTVDYVDSLTKSLNPHDKEQFVPTKILVESIFRKALVRIAALEGKKCSRLSDMIKCITPALEKQCGAPSAEALKISLLVGYLKQERKDELEAHFEGFAGEDDPLCTALHKYI